MAISRASMPRLLTMADQRSPQEMANIEWARVGVKYGFDPLSVQPDPSTKDRGTFLAQPVKPPQPANEESSDANPDT